MRVLEPSPNAGADFFTVDFGNNFADYGADPAVGGGLYRQAKEVQKVVDTLAALPAVSAVTLVGQGNGGLAARQYLAESQNVLGRVSSLVTYGSAHRGADTGYWCAAASAPGVSSLGGVFGRVIAGLTASTACANPDGVGGTRDVQFTCPVGVTDPLLSAFLSQNITLPDSVAYTSIVGGWQAHGWNAAILPDGGRRADDCLSGEWDGLVPRTSADLNTALVTTSQVQVIRSDRFTETEGDNLASVFCALSRCAVVRADTPVEVVVTTPSGQKSRRASPRSRAPRS